MCRICKSCGIGVGKGKSYCIECVKQKKSDDKHIWNKTSRKLKNGFNRKEEDAFLQNCVANGIDRTGLIRKEYTKLGKHPRSANWLLQRMKELGIYKEPNMKILHNSMQNSMNEYYDKIRDEESQRRIIISQNMGFSIVSNDTRLTAKIKCNKCGKISRYVVTKRNGCSGCRMTKNKIKIAENKKRIAEKKDKIKSVKIEGYKSRVDRLKEFVNNEGEYKKYTTYKETPISKEYVWYNSNSGIEYRETDLTYKLQWIGYYIYTTGVICPDTPIKDGYKICRKCKEHKDETNFSGNQCKECEKEYRREFILPNEIKKARYRYKTNPICKLDSLMRSYIYAALKGKYVKTKRTKEILGIEWDEFRKYIEDKFEDWMTWDNHGQGKGKWALQHIVPRDFVISEEELYVVNYYKNFIPMCAVDNGILKNRILKEQLNKWHLENKSIQQIIKRNEDRVVERIQN